MTALTSGKRNVPRSEMREGIQILRSPFVDDSRIGRGIRRLVFVLWATIMLLRLPADVIHYGSIPGVNRTTKSAVGLWFGFLLRLRHIESIYVHSLAAADDDSFLLTGVAGKLEKAFIRSSKSIISVSPKLQREAEELFPTSNTVLLPYGVRDDIFRPLSEAERETVRSDLNLDAESVVFGFLGSIDRRKGFDLLSEVFCEVSSDHGHWSLVAIGPKSRKESQNINDFEVERVTALVKNNPKVVMVGRIDDRKRLAQLIGAIDVFVFPSRREGMGIAPMEAMAAGVPPIIARIPGITDQVNIHELTGLYVNVGDTEDLKNAMRLLGNDAALRKKYGHAARQRIEESFGWESYIDSWEKLYESSVISNTV